MATYLVDLENTGLAGLVGLEELSVRDKVIVFYGTRTGSIAFDKHVELTKAKADVTYTKTERVAKNYLDFQLVTYLGYLIGSGQERIYYIISKDKGYDSCIEFWRKTDKQITITRCESLQRQKAGKSEAESRQPAVQSSGTQTAAGDEKAARMACEKQAANPKASEKQAAKSKASEKQAANPKACEKQAAKSKTCEKQKLPECMRKKIRKAVKEESLSSGSYKLLYDYLVKASDKHELNVALVKGFQQEKGNRLYKEILDVFVEYQKQRTAESGETPS